MNAYFRRRLEADDLVRRLCSCPTCGTLCRRERAGAVSDLSPAFVPWEHMPDWFLGDVLRQGIAGTTGPHRCPPAGSEVPSPEAA